MRRKTLFLASKVFLLFLFVFGLLLSCQQAVDNTKAEEEMKVLVEKLTEFYNTGNLELLEESFAPEATIHIMVKGYEEFTGIEDLKQNVIWLRDQYPDMVLKYNKEDLIIGGDKIVIPWVLTGTFAGTSDNIPDSANKKIDVEGLGIMQIKDGKIINEWRYFDRYAWAEQMGDIVTPVVEAAEEAAE